jgi:hypothetical protein
MVHPIVVFPVVSGSLFLCERYCSPVIHGLLLMVYTILGTSIGIDQLMVIYKYDTEYRKELALFLATVMTIFTVSIPALPYLWIRTKLKDKCVYFVDLARR